MSRSSFFVLMCAVTVVHAAVIAAAVDTSIARGNAPLPKPQLQIISMVKIDSVGVEPSIHTSMGVATLPILIHPVVKLNKSPKQAVEKAIDVAPALVLPTSTALLLPQGEPSLLPGVEATEGPADLAELLRSRLPYITGMVTLEFLIDSAGLTKQVNCLEESCNDVVLDSLSALLDLKFEVTPEMAGSSEFRKIIEIEPVQRF